MNVCHGNMHIFKFNDAVLSIDFVQAASSTSASTTSTTLDVPETIRYIPNNFQTK